MLFGSRSWRVIQTHKTLNDSRTRLHSSQPFYRIFLLSKKPLNVVESQSNNGSVIGNKTLETRNGSLKRGLIQHKDSFVEEVADSIEQIETQLSALRLCSRRLDFDDTTKSCTASSLVVSDIEERRQSFQPPPMSGFKRHGRTSTILPSERPVNTGALLPFVRSDDPSLSLVDDQFRLVKSRTPPLPSLPVRSIDFRKPSQGNKKTVSMNMKPTLLDKETDIWDEDSIGTESVTSSVSEDEELVSTELESEETRSSSDSNWETLGECVTESESGSSYSPQSDDDDEDSQVTASPPRKKRDKGSIGTAKKALGRLKRFKNKLGQVFHHHHHHHHEKEKGFKSSAWKNLQRTFQKKKDKSRKKSESKGLITHKQKHRGGQFQALVKGLMRHRRRSKKQKHKLQSHGKKPHWWKTLKKRQGGVKFPNGRRVKSGK